VTDWSHAYISGFFFSLGKCNAFCKVSMGSQEERTSVVSGSDCPLWDASMQFQVKDLFEDTLCITVFDKGYYSPDGKSLVWKLNNFTQI